MGNPAFTTCPQCGKQTIGSEYVPMNCQHCQRPLSLIRNASFAAGEWYEKAGKHPKQQEGYWRWVCPEPGQVDTTSELPSEVFECLESEEPQPWLFKNARAAELAAFVAATRAILCGWKPTLNEEE